MIDNSIMATIENFGCSSIAPLSLKEINERKSAVYRKDLSEPFQQEGSNDLMGTSVENSGMPSGRLEYQDSVDFDVFTSAKDITRDGPMDDQLPYETIGQPRYDEPYNPNERNYFGEVQVNKPAPQSLPAYELNRRAEKEGSRKGYLFWFVVVVLILLLIWMCMPKRMNQQFQQFQQL